MAEASDIAKGPPQSDSIDYVWGYIKDPYEIDLSGATRQTLPHPSDFIISKAR